MKVVESFDYVLNPLKFLVKCPHCGQINEEEYWIKYLICRFCGKISAISPDILPKMIELHEKHGKP